MKLPHPYEIYAQRPIGIYPQWKMQCVRNTETGAVWQYLDKGMRDSASWLGRFGEDVAHNRFGHGDPQFNDTYHRIGKKLYQISP